MVQLLEELSSEQSTMLGQVMVVISLLELTRAIKVLATDSSQLRPNWTGQAEILNCSLKFYQHFRQVVLFTVYSLGAWGLLPCLF